MSSLLLRLIAWLVPVAVRSRWCEEWRAEVRHGGWRMIPGALPDALALRQIDGEQRRQVRRARSGLWHALEQDIRYAIRSSVGAPSFTIAVVGSLAIGIGATTAAFTTVNAVLFRSYPQIHAQHELVMVKVAPQQAVWFQTSWRDYELLRDGIPAVTSLSIAHDALFAVARGGGVEPERTRGLVVSSDYFSVLGVRPARGRFFRPEEDGTPWEQPAVVISHRYWQRQLSEDPAVLQRTLTVNGTDLPIVGVAPEGFSGVFTRGEPQLWITFALSDLVFRDVGGRAVHVRGAGPFSTTLVGRLRPGATIEQASAQGAALAGPLFEANSRGEKQLFVRVEPVRLATRGTYWPFAIALMSVPLIVLAIACVNAANLLLARATRRGQEWLVRLSLGATRWRLVRQMLVESLLLALASGALGLILAFWGARFIQTFAPTRDVVIDVNVAAFALAAAVGTALLFGLGPALSVTRGAVTRAPGSGRLHGAFGSRTRAALVVLQVALCLGLLATGGQFINTLRATWDEGLPEAGQFLVVPIDVDPLRYDRGRAEAFYSGLLTQVQQLPRVHAAALTGRSAVSMLSGFVMSLGVQVSVNGKPESPRDRSLLTYATADFFETMGLRIVQGRTFTPAEQRPPARAVIVNEAFARKVGEDALGRVVQLAADGPNGTKTMTDAMIVGVVAASPNRPLFSRLPNVFYPAPVNPAPALDLVVRFEGDADGIAAAVRTIVSGMDQRIPLGPITTGEDLRRIRHSSDYTVAQAISGLGVVALMLAAAGLYGVVSYMVTLRHRELGIRIALGAERSSVLYLVLRQAIVPVALGCVLGACGAVAIGSLVRSQLYGVSAMDPIAFGGAALLLVGTMILAALAPARRAARVDPVEILRAE